MKPSLVVAIVIVVVLVAGYFLATNMSSTSTPAQMDEKTVEMPKLTEQTITLSKQNNSGQSGTATISEENGQVVVTIKTTGGPDKTPQPAHIHIGSCPDVGDVKYPLTSLVDGTSTTTIQTTLEDLKEAGPLGINIHKSTQEASVYYSCGDLIL